MVQISLAIRGLQVQHTQMRAGGLYWVLADHLADAKRLAQQVLQEMPEHVPATLICCGQPVQNIVSTLAPECGPDTLSMFEIPATTATQGLSALTRELSRAGVTRGSHVLLFAPLDNWTPTLRNNGREPRHLEHWCERLHTWLRARATTLLIISHGHSLLMYKHLLKLNETLSGLSHLYRHEDDICYQLNFWHNDRGVAAGQAFKLSVEDNVLTLIPETSIDTQARVADDQFVFLAERAVLEGTPAPSHHWYVFQSHDALIDAAHAAQAATVIIAMDSSHSLIELAQQVHDLREHCGSALKIVVREMEPAVRYRDEHLLLASGANLVVPYGTQLSRFLNTLESIQGQHWLHTWHHDFAQLLERQRPPHLRGLVSPKDFILTLRKIYKKTVDVPHQLVRFEPAPGLDHALFLSQICLRRDGDFACLLDGYLYLFLFACRADGLEPALSNICRLPWRDLFISRQTLAGPDELAQDAFMHVSDVPENARIAVQSTEMLSLDSLSRTPLNPQPITLVIGELQP